MQFWNELEGQVLDGYPLLRLVRSEGRSAWFETEVQNGTPHPAIISLAESFTDVDEVIDRLEAAQRIKHPNLVSIEKVGYARFDRALFVYAVMEHTDQNLSDVLREQTLSAAEAHQIAEAMVGALTEIHQQGLVHGHVEPASVLAVGEEVKLRSDCLQSPGGTRAGDIAGIGTTLFQAFTQRQASSADDAQINRIPAPFAEIIRNSLSSRWSLAQIAAVLKPPAVPSSKAAAAVPVTTPPPIGTPPSVTPAESPAPAAAGLAVTPPVTPPPRPAATAKPFDEEPEKPQSPSESRPTLIYAAIAIALLLILGWLIFRPKSHNTAAPTSTPETANPAPAHAPVATNPVSQSPRVQPSTPTAGTPGAKRVKPSAVHTTPQSATQAIPQAASAGPNTRSVWRVIVYTYRRQDQAQEKVDELNGAHSDLRASVFSGGGGTYLVIVGGAMDRVHAFAMRDKARGEGLPPDTYAQNFSE